MLLWTKTKKLAMQSAFRYEPLLTDDEAKLYTYDMIDRRQRDVRQPQVAPPDDSR